MARGEQHRLAYHAALDGLRGVAVAGVVAYHLGWIPGGFLGVDVFFVLSGYLITSLLLAEREATGRVALAEFWARRARRLLPALLAMVAVLLVVAPDELRRGDVLASVGYLANWHQVASQQSYFDLFDGPSPLRHAWSLAIEEQFYLLWPLVVAAVVGVAATRRRGRDGRRALVCTCAAGAVASAFAMAVWYEAGDPSRVYYGTDTRAHLLLVGAALAAWRPRRAAQLPGVVGLGASAVGMAVVGDTAAWLYRGGMLAHALGIAAVIAAVTTRPVGRLARVLGWAPLRVLGLVSYGVYLWHWPVIVLLNPARTGLDGGRLDLVRLAVTGAAAAVSYFVVERPIRRWALPPRRALAGAAAALGAMLVAGAAVPPGPARERVLVAAPDPVEAIEQARAARPAPGPSAASPPGGSGPAAVAARREPRTIAVVGDSVASTVAYGLTDAAGPQGLEVVSVAIPGCGLAAGVALREDGSAFDWSDECADAVPGLLEGLVAADDPDVVVWLSTWELSDREERGEHVAFGTRAHEHALVAAIDAQVRRLTARGATVVFLPPVPSAPNDRVFPDAPPWRYARYEGLLAEYVAAHPARAEIVDLGAIVCPGGAPCPAEVDGVVARPDGFHFTEESSRWLGQHLLPLVVAAARG